MGERVAIVTAAQTKFKASKENLSVSEMIWEVVEKILRETGLKFEAQVRDKGRPFIDKIISCSEDYWQGRTISDCLYHLEMGALGMSATKVAGDGASAVYHGVVNILSGKSNVVLVVAWRKESETVRSVLENAGLDPIYLRPLGVDFLMTAAMQANRYMHKYGITEEQCAQVVVKNRGNAFRNPYAQEPLSLSVADVLNSEMLSYPIRALDCKPVSDGACALILASEEEAKELTSKPVWITGIGNCYDAHYPGDRDLSDFDSLPMATQKAYKMGGIKDLRREIYVAIVHGCFTITEMVIYENFGFSQWGKAREDIENGAFTLEGELPVNTDGGLKCLGHPLGAGPYLRWNSSGFRGERGYHPWKERLRGFIS